MSPAAAPVRPAQTGGEEPSLSADAFQRLAALLRTETGIHLTDAKAPMMVSRLVRRQRALRLPDLEGYARLVLSPDGAAERRHMVEALTTNYTFFAREPHHFRHLREHALPPLLERARAGGRVRIWSAGCSTGQEAYGVALALAVTAGEAAAAMDLRVLATDIDRGVLGTARSGRYDAEALAALAPAERELGFAAVAGGGFEARPALRSLIRFRELNLLAEWPMRGLFDAVFLRNVLIYFDQPTRERVWLRMAGRLRPGGWLYAGHSERLTGPAGAMFAHEGPTTYRRLAE